MKRFLVILILTNLMLISCDSKLALDPDAPMRATLTATATKEAINLSTPTPMGTWETVIDGRIYDSVTEPSEPIDGAFVSYIVLHSHFAELQEDRPNETITDELGMFALPVIVHDTDSIKILVEAPGYRSYEEKLVGVDLIIGRTFDIGLTPVLTVTAPPP